MRSIAVALLVLLFAVPRATAGEVFGTVTDGGKPVPTGVKVVITAPGGKTYAGETDKFGSYRIFVKEKGKCTITVTLKEDLAPEAELVSFDKSTRYDWVLVSEEGKTILRRK
jgi:hypothetical protein